MNNVLGMTPEIAKRHATLRSFEQLIKLAEQEKRDLTEEEINEGVEQEGNNFRIKVISAEFCERSNNPNNKFDDDRIDIRYNRTDQIPLICNKCGALFSTKNIDYIGARSIFPFFGNRRVYTLYSLLAGTCNHSLRDLRLPSKEEFDYLKGIEKC